MTPIVLLSRLGLYLTLWGCTGLLSIIKPLKLAVRALGRLGGPVHIRKHHLECFRHLYIIIYKFIYLFLIYLIHYFYAYSGTFRTIIGFQSM